MSQLSPYLILRGHLWRAGQRSRALSRLPGLNKESRALSRLPALLHVLLAVLLPHWSASSGSFAGSSAPQPLEVGSPRALSQAPFLFCLQSPWEPQKYGFKSTCHDSQILGPALLSPDSFIQVANWPHHREIFNECLQQTQNLSTTNCRWNGSGA